MNEYWVVGYMFLVTGMSMFTVLSIQDDKAKKILTFSGVAFLIGGLIVVFSQIL